jgi:isohexenylglutaconyl-CoA hydratase
MPSMSASTRLASARVVLLVDWPSREVPETLARCGFTTLVKAGPEPDRYDAWELQGDVVITRGVAAPTHVDLVYVHRPLAELPALVELARKLGAATLWLQSGKREGGDADPRGCWLADEERAQARARVEAAGLAWIDEPYLPDVARALPPRARSLPTTTTLRLERDRDALHVWLARPEVRNAMNGTLITELGEVFSAIADDRSVRAVVLRGEGGNFCAGGDVKDMAATRNAPVDHGIDPIAAYNRRFGAIISAVERAPQVTIAVLEGAVLGGGFGLACVVDIAIAKNDATFGLPETGLGIPPAQIAPFVVRRIGLSQAKRLALTGARFDGKHAKELGIVHEVVDDRTLAETLGSVLDQVRRCAPGANAATKAIMLQVGITPIDALLDDAAARFAAATRGPEAAEGMMAFVQKRKPSWST